MISRDNSNGKIRFIIQDLENKLRIFNRNYDFTLFSEIGSYNSSRHDNRSNCNQIDENFQSLASREREIDPIITLEVVIILPMLLVGMILIGIQLLEQELVVPMDMTNLMIAVALLIEVLDTISMVLSPSSLQGHIFLIMDHQPNHLSQHIQVMKNSFNHILTMQIIVLICMLVVGLMMMMILSPLVIQHGID